jgi:uncharacterized membrane protein
MANESNSMIELIGRLHVALVHLPIGILLLACFFIWLERIDRFSALRSATPLMLGIGMLSALLSVISGFLLSRSGDYDLSLVSLHQWFGIAVACVSAGLFFLRRRSSYGRLSFAASIVLVLLVGITGHLGGTLTHGAGYLFSSGGQDSAQSSVKPVPNVHEARLFGDIIQPILTDKCSSCHGPHKQKGKLRLDDSLHIAKGGKDGPVLVPGNIDKSELFRRVSLPLEDDDHMPPKQKTQLSSDQLSLLRWWISAGSPFTKTVREVEQPESIKPSLVRLQSGVAVAAPPALFPATPVARADEDAVSALRNTGAVVEAVSQASNYLSVNLVIASSFSNRQMHLLLPLKKQIVELKLSGTSIDDSASEIVGQCENLVRLYLDHTRISDASLLALRSLQHLQYLNLVATHVTANGLGRLKDLKSLHTIYLYQTGIRGSDFAALRRALPNVTIDSGGYSVPLLPTDTTEVKPPKIKQ